MINKNYYPTPKPIIKKMWDKIKNKENIHSILEPSAGKGDIIDYIQDLYRYQKHNISCIELNETLQATLKGKNYKLIDSDFLAYSGVDKFDLIIANPPFDEGYKHLMKAIDIMFNGEIIFILNAETLKNPYSNTRKILIQKLEELNADIEYVKDAFMGAERKTKVEIAIIHIIIENSYVDNLLDNCDTTEDPNIDIEDKKELASSNSIEFLVQDFNATIDAGLHMIKYYYENVHKVGAYLRLHAGRNNTNYSETYTQDINNIINAFASNVRIDYWKKVLLLEDVQKRMTRKKLEEFHDTIQKQSNMDFTEKNIRSFILNLIGNYETILTEAVAEIFDKMSKRHHWNEETEKNIHYFNGWKTNKAHFVNKKVILPFYNGFFDPIWKKWKLEYGAKEVLNDIDIVMNYFDGSNKYTSIANILEESLENNKTKNIESTYFTMSVYKKGTIHLTFKSENIRRRFNVIACKHKKWLFNDYGNKKYTDMTKEEKTVVNEFEGQENYNKNINQIGFVKKDLKLLN